MKKKILSSLLVVVASLFMGVNLVEAENEPIKIGSKDFTESLIVSEIYALALEDQGYEVERVPNIASSVIPQSLKKGEIDLYAEYTGTALLSVFKKEVNTDPDEVYNKVKNLYKKQKLVALPYAPANDSAGIAIKTSVAKKHNISTMSQFQKKANKIRFASQGEFDQREDGLPGLEKVYGPFDFKSSKVYDNSLKYQILENDEADAIPAYTTEGQLADTSKFTVLKDDKNFWPPYNLMPVVRQETVKNYPKLTQTINQIDKKLTTKKMIQLNKAVDIDGKDYREVAKEYYQNQSKKV